MLDRRGNTGTRETTTETERKKRTTEIRQEWHYMAAENPPRRARRQAPLNEADLSIHTHRLELEPCLLVATACLLQFSLECDLWLCGPACVDFVDGTKVCTVSSDDDADRDESIGSYRSTIICPIILKMLCMHV